MDGKELKSASKYASGRILTTVCLITAILTFTSAITAESTEPFKEYKLTYAGTIYLPPDWNVVFPESDAKPISHSGSSPLIELRAVTPKKSESIVSDITFFRFNNTMMKNALQYPAFWGSQIRSICKEQYADLLKNSTLTVISETLFESGDKRGLIATYEIPNPIIASLQIRVKYLLIYYDYKFFLLRMNYYRQSEEYVSAITEEILSQWKMPPSFIQSALTWLTFGLIAILILTIWNRIKKLKGGIEDPVWENRPL